GRPAGPQPLRPVCAGLQQPSIHPPGRLGLAPDRPAVAAERLAAEDDRTQSPEAAAVARGHGHLRPGDPRGATEGTRRMTRMEKSPYKNHDRWYRAIIRAALVWLRTCDIKVEMTGLEHIPADGPALLACNHLSFVDYMIQGFPAVKKGRLTRFVSKSEILAT